MLELEQVHKNTQNDNAKQCTANLLVCKNMNMKISNKPCSYICMYCLYLAFVVVLATATEGVTCTWGSV